jgi:hypothetical protein
MWFIRCQNLEHQRGTAGSLFAHAPLVQKDKLRKGEEQGDVHYIDEGKRATATEYVGHADVADNISGVRGR